MKGAGGRKKMVRPQGGSRVRSSVFSRGKLEIWGTEIATGTTAVHQCVWHPGPLHCIQTCSKE